MHGKLNGLLKVSRLYEQKGRGVYASLQTKLTSTVKNLPVTIAQIIMLNYMESLKQSENLTWFHRLHRNKIKDSQPQTK